MDAIKTKGILVTFYRDAIGGDYLESLNIAIKELEKLSSEVKQVQCRNCHDIVEMMSTGEVCPSCFC
jgi:hypothetical protein